MLQPETKQYKSSTVIRNQYTQQRERETELCKEGQELGSHMCTLSSATVNSLGRLPFIGQPARCSLHNCQL